MGILLPHAVFLATLSIASWVIKSERGHLVLLTHFSLLSPLSSLLFPLILYRILCPQPSILFPCNHEIRCSGFMSGSPQAGSWI